VGEGLRLEVTDILLLGTIPWKCTRIAEGTFDEPAPDLGRLAGASAAYPSLGPNRASASAFRSISAA
jgi:hypothetical protein